MVSFLICFTGYDYTTLLNSSALLISNDIEKYAQHLHFMRGEYLNSHESSFSNEFNIYDVRIIYIIRTNCINLYCQK